MPLSGLLVAIAAPLIRILTLLPFLVRMFPHLLLHLVESLLLVSRQHGPNLGA